MNIYIYLSFLGLCLFGIILKKLWDIRISNIIRNQIQNQTNQNSKDILCNLFGSEIKIVKIENTKGIGADYYNMNDDVFYLTEEAIRNNSASVTIGLFLGLLKIQSNKKKILFSISNTLSTILFPIFILAFVLSFFSHKVLYFEICFLTYFMLVFVEAIKSIDISMTKKFIKKSFKSKIHLSKSDEFFINEFIANRRGQLFSLIFFNPMLSICYYIYYFIRS